MKQKLIKEFRDYDWLGVIRQIKLFIVDFGLELTSIDLKKEKNFYVATIKYDLGVRK